jgi:hypothetical protein
VWLGLVLQGVVSRLHGWQLDDGVPEMSLQQCMAVVLTVCGLQLSYGVTVRL